MSHGITQRTAIAITLMGVLLLAFGTCVVPATPATHRCCKHMSMPCHGKADCCKVNPQIPATGTPFFSGHAGANVSEDFFSSASDAALRGQAISPVVASQSSPP